jgi:hypothetical protein
LALELGHSGAASGASDKIFDSYSTSNFSLKERHTFEELSLGMIPLNPLDLGMPGVGRGGVELARK